MIGAIAAAVSLELIHGLTGCWRDKHLDDVAELGPQHPGHAVVEAPQWVSQWVSLQLQHGTVHRRLQRRSCKAVT